MLSGHLQRHLSSSRPGSGHCKICHLEQRRFLARIVHGLKRQQVRRSVRDKLKQVRCVPHQLSIREYPHPYVERASSCSISGTQRKFEAIHVHSESSIIHGCRYCFRISCSRKAFSRRYLNFDIILPAFFSPYSQLVYFKFSIQDQEEKRERTRQLKVNYCS